ncbi:MAG: alpha-galactosidase, partial [Actinomycetota bacterium]
MRRTLGILVSLVLVTAVVPRALADEATTTGNGSSYVIVSNDEVVVGNALVERRWQRDGFETLSVVDNRSADGIRAGVGPDFHLTTGLVDIPSTAFDVAAVRVEEISGGIRAEIELSGPGLSATRIVDVYDGVAGFRTQTTLVATGTLALQGYTLDETLVGDSVAPTIHAFRAGADWREPGWAGADLAIGDKHGGTWRDSRSAAPGQSLEGPAQWLSTAKADHSLFMVMERNDWPSSRATYDGTTASLEVDYSRELVMFGPFEESIHAENPTSSPGRHRILKPGIPFALESAFIGFGTNPSDEAWQFHKYLIDHRLDPYDHEVTFNSNGTDANVRSDGAKDDMVEEVVLEVAPKAKELGIETFILDDGWQARSGDWHPDCWDKETGEQHTDPRWDGTEASKFRPRFTDCSFETVREAIAPMQLGLWMTPMHFHPRSETYQSHPEWGCKPVGDAVGALSIIEPSGGSNDAGLGTWSAHPDLIRHVESRIQHAIDAWGVTYFKFDFLVWLDCVGQGDLYDYKEAFIAMLDRLIAANPNVTFQIDETNDYRLFPYESVTRGPSWFQNGSPEPNRLLHNLWNLSPYVPAFSLGQHFLGGRAYERYPVDSLMAASLLSHLTFFSDLRTLPTDVVLEARPWIDFY